MPPASVGGSSGPLDFVVVGMPKSGTTTLHQLLVQHPDLFLPVMKEPYHYAPDLCRAEVGPFRPSTRAQYLDLFAAAEPGQRRGEASACYVFSDVAPEALARDNPGCRAVVVFREPVAFLRSWHLQLLRDPRHEVVADLGEALALEPARAEGRDLPPAGVLPQFLAYRRLVRYADHLDRLHEAFGVDHVLPLLFDDLVADPVAVAEQVHAFLGVAPLAPEDPGVQNVGTAVRHPRTEAALIRLAVGHPGDRGVVRAAAAAKRALPEPVDRALRAAARAVLHRDPPPEDDELDRALRAELRPEVERLGERLDRPDLVVRWS